MFPQKIIIKIDDPERLWNTKIRNQKLDFTVFDDSFNSLNEIKGLFKKATQKGHILIYVTLLYNDTIRC